MRSVHQSHVSIPSSSHSRQPIADAEMDAILFHAFPEKKYFRSVVLGFRHNDDFSPW